MKTSDFYYDLPQELIAQDPIEDRSASRLLVLGKQGYVNPVIAGLAPTVAFIAYGIDRVVRNQA